MCTGIINTESVIWLSTTKATYRQQSSKQFVLQRRACGYGNTNG